MTAEISQALMEWFYSQEKLPWRDEASPYRIWILETMAQQTVVTVVLKRYPQWLDRFPTLESLACCEEKDVLLAWEGLGYYSRAKNLRKTACLLQQNGWPQTLKGLTALPGIGLYTAKSILSRAFNFNELAFDANLKRVFMRLRATSKLSLKDEASIEKELQPCMQQAQARFFNQAIMRLGQLICIKAKPKCFLCPLQTVCQAYKENRAESIIPLKKRAIEKKSSLAAVFVCKEEAFIEQRQQGVGQGLYSFPRYPLTDKGRLASLASRIAPLTKRVHTYTRYKEELSPCIFFIPNKNSKETQNQRGLWLPITQLNRLAFLSVYRAIARELQVFVNLA